MGYFNDHLLLEIQSDNGQYQQGARRITHTPCSRRACGQCGQVNPKAYFKLDLSKACGKALLRQTPNGFSTGWHCPQAQDDQKLDVTTPTVGLWYSLGFQQPYPLITRVLYLYTLVMLFKENVKDI